MKSLLILLICLLAAANSVQAVDSNLLMQLSGTITMPTNCCCVANAWFEYGLSKTNALTTTPAQTVTNTTAIVDTIGPVVANTVYWHRTVSTNSAGVSYGSWAWFCRQLPIQVTTGVATGITSSAASISGTVANYH